MATNAWTPTFENAIRTTIIAPIARYCATKGIQVSEGELWGVVCGSGSSSPQPPMSMGFQGPGQIQPPTFSQNPQGNFLPGNLPFNSMPMQPGKTKPKVPMNGEQSCIYVPTRGTTGRCTSKAMPGSYLCKKHSTMQTAIKQVQEAGLGGPPNPGMGGPAPGFNGMTQNTGMQLAGFQPPAEQMSAVQIAPGFIIEVNHRMIVQQMMGRNIVVAWLNYQGQLEAITPDVIDYCKRTSLEYRTQLEPTVFEAVKGVDFSRIDQLNTRPKQTMPQMGQPSTLGLPTMNQVLGLPMMNQQQPMGLPNMSQQPMGLPVMNQQQPIGQQPMGLPQMNQQPMGLPQMNQQPMGLPQMNQQPMGLPQMNQQQPMGLPNMNQQQPMGLPNMNQQQPMGLPQMSQQSMGQQSMGLPTTNQQPMGLPQMPTPQPSGLPTLGQAIQMPTQSAGLPGMMNNMSISGPTFNTIPNEVPSVTSSERPDDVVDDQEEEDEEENEGDALAA